MPSDLTASVEQADAWANGWWAEARACPSPNFGPRPPQTTIDLIVVHSISLPPGVFGGGEIERLFTNRLDWDAHPYFDLIRGMEVSSHFLIRRDGELVQFVSTHDRAWHAGTSAWCGRENCNDFSIGVELEGLEGGQFEATQYQRLTALCQSLRTQHPITQVAGHEHIAPGRKQDPGPGFDWPLFQHALNWPADCFPKTTQPPANQRI
ncbi:MAG: 1,6-anhydro-N-acetylmuramyl-L-alanine amidase AmpD [Burkholderiaceae bacterium]